VILFGSKEEAAVTAEVAEKVGAGVIDLAGQTTLAEAVGILSLADLMISNDMGLAHIAAAVDTATIVLFGPTDPQTTRPWGSNVAVLKGDAPCKYCERNDRSARHICARWPSVEQVRSALDHALAQKDVDELATIA
jgi:heptosyltransferase-2